jgi:hypothetical protein
MIIASFVALLTLAEINPLYIPIPLQNKIGTVESTSFDIGTYKQIFDMDESTLARTPAINPAFVRVEFREPVSFEAMRLVFTNDVHDVTVLVGESLDALKRGAGKTLFEHRKTDGGKLLVTFSSKRSVKALELKVKRQTGDDYVHIVEWQLCVPGKATGLAINRLTDRRDSTKTQSVNDPIRVYEDTVVVFTASAATGGGNLVVTDRTKWVCMDKGVVPYPGEAGQFLVKKPGRHEIEASLGELKKKIVIEGLAREVKNTTPDLDVMYIERLPRIAYDAPNAGLPTAGQRITWRAHVWNWSPSKTPLSYTWTLDGKVMAEAKAVAPAKGEVTVDLPWAWDRARHELTIHVQPLSRIRELIQKNNDLTIQTDAVTAGFWVERSLWDFMHEHQYQLPTEDANSFADWGQRMMRQWNGMFGEAKYRSFPQGVLERVRLDKIVVVPDFALPLAGGIPSNNPDNRDKTIDMAWGMEGADIAPDKPYDPKGWWSFEKAIDALNSGRVKDRKEDPPFWCGLGYIHELNHARYLVDSYGFNVHSDTGADPSKWSIKVQDEQGPIMGRYIPLKGDLMWSEKHVGIMGGDYWKFSAFETMCWNRVRGQRARGGNCNSPDTIGEFLNDIPKRVVLQFVDASGSPLNDAEVWVYRAHGTGNGWYTKVYENEPALKVKADSSGRATFDRTLWSANGKIEHTFGVSQAVALLRVTYKGKHYFLFECVADSNIAYNLGLKDEVVLKRQIRLRTGDPKPEEWDARETWEVPGGGYEVRL